MSEIELDKLQAQIAKMRKAATRPTLDDLASMGVRVDPEKGVHIPPEALQAIRERRMRRATISKVPSTPRHVYRDGGGVGVGKGMGRFEVLTLQTLRRVREKSSLVQSIHSARHIQISRFSKRWTGKLTDVGYRVVHRDHTDYDAVPPKGIESYIRRFENLLAKPCESYDVNTLSALLVPLWEDFATINRPVVEILRSAMDQNRIVGFRPLDGALVWPTLVWLEKWQKDNPRYWGSRDPDTMTDDELIGLVSEIVGHDIGGADHCIVRDGILERVMDKRDMIVAPRYNRTDIERAGYPPSYVEQAIECILSAMNTDEYNSAFFTRGMMAEFILAVVGEYSDEAIDVFMDTMRDATMGVENAWAIPILGLPDDGDLKKIDMKAPNREMMYEVWESLLISRTCAIYRMDPTEICAKPWEGGGGPQLSSPSRAEEIKSAKEEGLSADLDHIAEAILTPLAQTCHPDLMVIWHHGDHDPKAEADITEVRCRVHVTRNEARLQEGMKPKGDWLSDDDYETASDEEKKKHDDNPWNWPTDPGFAQTMQQRAQAEQMQAQQEQMGAEQQPEAGQPPEQEPKPDGFGGADMGQDDGFGQPVEEHPYGQAPENLEKGRPFRVFIRHVPV